MKLEDVKKGSILFCAKKYKDYDALSEFDVLDVRNSTPRYFVLKYKKRKNDSFKRSLYFKDYIFYIDEKELKKYFIIDITKKEKRDFILEKILS